jgi:hypothetical protein
MPFSEIVPVPSENHKKFIHVLGEKSEFWNIKPKQNESRNKARLSKFHSSTWRKLCNTTIKITATNQNRIIYICNDILGSKYELEQRKQYMTNTRSIKENKFWLIV